MIIYKTTNLINGKIYVGQSKYNNPKYFGSGKLLKTAVKKYGKKNFEKVILCECESLEELNTLERFWIEKLDSRNLEIGYNIERGGQHSDSGERISSSLKGKKRPKRSKEWCDNLSKSRQNSVAWNKGKKMGPISEEVRLNLQGRIPWNKGKIGVKASEETKEKMKQSQIEAWKKRR